MSMTEHVRSERRTRNRVIELFTDPSRAESLGYRRLGDWNIEDNELAAFRALAKAYAGLTERQIEQLLQARDLTEICHDD